MVKPLTANNLIKELSLARYISSEHELKEITAKCRDVFAAQIDRTSDGIEHVETALGFIRTIWRKYDCERVADVYDKFVKVEEALFGLERDEDAGKRYRDHFVHMFNCFMFGLRIISAVLAQCPPRTAKQVFKVEDESLKEVGLPFGSNYRYDQRLFYLWMLISTFHDIAVPFQHLAAFGKGISGFIEEFGWMCTDPRISMHHFDSSQLYHYFHLISSLFGGRLRILDEGRRYAQSKEKQHYLAKLLGREFDRHNHGVLSGFFMWKTVEEVFLVGRSHKYSLGADEFNKYTAYVLEQDIARAALAISLHALGKDERSGVFPKVFPLRFDSFPLTFLLILADELQEYLRWEGVSLRRQLKFCYHPLLTVKYDKRQKCMNMTVSFSLDSTSQDIMISQAKHMTDSPHVGQAATSISEVADVIGNAIKQAIERKLSIGDNVKLRLNIYEDWQDDKIRYGKDLCSLDYQ